MRSGAIPFGWTADRYGRLTPNPSAQAVIENMKGFRASGFSYARIADSLNAAGIKSAHGGQWFPSAVNCVLRTAERNPQMEAKAS